MMRFAQILAAGYLVLALLLTGLTVLVGPVGSAPFPLTALGPAGDPVVVSIAYGTEKRLWLEEAKRRFEATNPRIGNRPIQIELQGIGSREMVTQITQGQLRPTVVSPASSIQIELLRNEWQVRQGGAIFLSGDEAPRPLVLTPLVLVMWEERARALWPNGSDDFWDRIHTALANDEGWRALGGDPNWGLVKFGHTSPETSNSGTQILVLLAYGFYGKASGLTVGDVTRADFQEWLDAIERSVLEFGDSTGTFMTNMVNFGPGKYDFVAVYENLALENIENARGRWGQAIRIYYPPANILSDHPYATLNAAWVTPEQRAAAARFRDFLLSREIQELALQYGFRPGDPSVPVVTADPNNPFNKYRDYGVQVDIPQVVNVPSADVLNELITLWRRKNYQG